MQNISSHLKITVRRQEKLQAKKKSLSIYLSNTTLDPTNLYLILDIRAFEHAFIHFIQKER